MKALAVVFVDRLRVEVVEVRVPDPDADDVVIDVKHSWISVGTESSYLRAERIGGEQARRDTDPWPFPHVPGYQKVGVVREVGAAVQGLRPGDRVFASNSRVSGMYFPFAGHISPAVTSADQVWKLPEDAPGLPYAGMVLTQVGYNCGTRPGLSAGDRAVVIGDGLVGQWAAQTLLHRGARVNVVGRHERRLRHLPVAPGIRAIDARSEDAAAALAQEGSISVVVDTVGNMDAVHAVLPLVERNGHLVSAGFLGEHGRVDIQELRRKEITLHTPSGWTRERMNQTLAGIRDGWLHAADLITHRFPATHAAEAWDLILSRREDFLGVVLDW